MVASSIYIAVGTNVCSSIPHAFGRNLGTALVNYSLRYD